MKMFKEFRLHLLCSVDGPTASSGGAAPAAASTPEAPVAPASTSSGVSPEPATVDAGASSDDAVWSDIFGDGPSDVVPEPKVPVTPPAPAAKPAEAAKPASGAKPAEPAKVVEVKPAAPVAPAAPAPTEATSAPVAQLDPYDPSDLVRRLTENEAAAIEHVASTMFKLSPEEIEALESDTVGTVPKLFAKAFVRTQQNVLQQIARLVPTMIMRQQAVMVRHAENEGKFYERWKDLKAETHGKLVNQYAAVYRQMNPTATLEQMVEAVGPMVLMAAGVQPTVHPQGSTQPPSVPVNPMASTRPLAQPFQPAGPVAGGASQPIAVEANPVEIMFNPPDQET